MNDQTINGLGVAAVVLLALVGSLAAVKCEIIGPGAPMLGNPHA